MRLLRLDWVSSSEEETIRFGERLGTALRSSAAVALVGPLGAGKTRLAQGIARGAGFSGRVRSPTFALLHVYRGRVPVRHFDLYRLDGIDEATAGEWEEQMDDGAGLSIVEWADRFPDLLPPQAIWVRVEPVGETARRIEVRLHLPTNAIDAWRLC